VQTVFWGLKKKLLSGFTKDMQWKICAEKVWMDTVSFATDLIAYAFFGVSPSVATRKIYGRRVFTWIMQGDLVRFALHHYLPPQNDVLNHMSICDALGRLHCWSWKWSVLFNLSFICRSRSELSTNCATTFFFALML